MKNREMKIGVFDSGVGGLTVVRRLLELAPGLQLVYFGDTARVPYGTKSPETIQRYAEENTAFLKGFDPGLIIVACNSVSALAFRQVQGAAQGVPVYGVIEPGVELATQLTLNKKIGVIGTIATIQSGAYEKALKKKNSELQIYSQACPLFVPLAEEGWFNHAATELVAREYLRPLLAQGVDTLVLGCTHYPMLWGVIEKIVGDSVRIVDSGEAVANLIYQQLSCVGDVSPSPGKGGLEIYVSDLPSRFQKTAELFLGRAIALPKKVET